MVMVIDTDMIGKVRNRLKIIACHRTALRWWLIILEKKSKSKIAFEASFEKAPLLNWVWI